MLSSRARGALDRFVEFIDRYHEQAVTPSCNYAVMTEAFLTFSRQAGNDLSTPRPEWEFPGLQPGDHWCLCAARWKEALDAGLAPPVVLEATHIASLEYVSLEELQAHACPE